MLRTLTLSACVATLLIGCVVTEPPSVCDVRGDELVLFPDGDVDVPTNMVVRVIVGDRGAGLFVRLIDEDHGGVEPGVGALIPTTFGDVLEFVPDNLLIEDTLYGVEVVDGGGAIVAATTFETGRGEEVGRATETGESFIDPIRGADRQCCSGRGCVDGSVIQMPPLTSESYVPQMVLIHVDEVFNDACGPTSAPVGTVPVVWNGTTSQGVVAETDLLLDGCFDLTLVSQTLREAASSDIVCAPGYSFTPRGPTAECRASGCSCEASPGPGPVGLALLAAGVLLALRRWRRRLAS